MKTLPLLKQIIPLSEARAEEKVPRDILADISKKLAGRKIQAFGKKGRGLWGESDDVQTYTITSITPKYFSPDGDKRMGVTFDINLDGYNPNKYGLIYTDGLFLKEFKALLVKLGLEKVLTGLDYSEHGMQVGKRVNMDGTIKLPKAVK